MMQDPESAATAGPSESKVWLENATKNYGSVVAVAEIDLDVIRGEFLTLWGRVAPAKPRFSTWSPGRWGQRRAGYDLMAATAPGCNRTSADRA